MLRGLEYLRRAGVAPDERLRIEELRREIKVGTDQIKHGKYKDYASADDLISDIRTRGQARLKARRKTKKR